MYLCKSKNCGVSLFLVVLLCGFISKEVRAAPLLSQALTERASVTIDPSDDYANASYFPPTQSPGLFDGVVDGKYYQLGKFSGGDAFSVVSYRLCAEVAGNGGVNEFGYFNSSNVFTPLFGGAAVVGSVGAIRQPPGEEWELAIHTPVNPFGPEFFGHTLDLENVHDVNTQPQGIATAIVQKVVTSGFVYLPVADKNPSSYNCPVLAGDTVIFFEDLGSTAKDYNDLVVVVNQGRCFENRQSAVLSLIQSNASSQESHIRSIGKGLIRIVGSRNKKMRSKVSSTNLKAKKLLENIRANLAVIPPTTVTCEAAISCPVIDVAGNYVQQLSGLSNELYKLGRSIAQEYTKLRKRSTTATLNKKAKKYFVKVGSLSSTVVTSSISCPIVSR